MPDNAAGLSDAKSANIAALVTADMAPDSTTRYTEGANRLVDKAVEEATIRPIRKRRATIAAETDTLTVNPNAHADIMREVASGSYNPWLGSTNTAEAA